MYSVYIIRTGCSVCITLDANPENCRPNLDQKCSNTQQLEPHNKSRFSKFCIENPLGIGKISVRFSLLQKSGLGNHRDRVAFGILGSESWLSGKLTMLWYKYLYVSRRVKTK